MSAFLFYVSLTHCLNNLTNQLPQGWGGGQEGWGWGLLGWEVGGGGLLTSQNQKVNLINLGWKLQRPSYSSIQSSLITLGWILPGSPCSYMHHPLPFMTVYKCEAELVYTVLRARLERYGRVMCDVSRDEGAGRMVGYRMVFVSRAPAALFISSHSPQTDPLPVWSPWCYPADRK